MKSYWTTKKQFKTSLPAAGVTSRPGIIFATGIEHDTTTLPRY